MSDIWPCNVGKAKREAPDHGLRAFRCLLLMPFESRFTRIAEFLEQTVRRFLDEFAAAVHAEVPVIERLDWVDSAGAIQTQVWERIADADLVFCDITGHNPNVLFEAGVCAAWKDVDQVVFIRDRFFREAPAFDIAPFRYASYELTSDGTPRFEQKILRLLQDVLVRFPDRQGSAPEIPAALQIDFGTNRDDARVYTPPFAHRRIRNGWLEFGSVWSFPHSWASVGKKPILDFDLQFTARFINPLPDAGYIGIGVRSQHFYANYGHVLYINKDGSIVMTEPDENPPAFYTDKVLRRPGAIDIDAEHHFRVAFGSEQLLVQVDDFKHSFPVATMKKTFGAGLLRFQCFKTWMGIKRLNLTV